MDDGFAGISTDNRGAVALKLFPVFGGLEMGEYFSIDNFIYKMFLISLDVFASIIVI